LATSDGPLTPEGMDVIRYDPPTSQYDVLKRPLMVVLLKGGCVLSVT
jgi:hypothetical protein